MFITFSKLWFSIIIICLGQFICKRSALIGQRVCLWVCFRVWLCLFQFLLYCFFVIAHASFQHLWALNIAIVVVYQNDILVWLINILSGQIIFMDCIFEISQSSICSAFIIKHFDIWASFPFFVSLLPYVPFTPEIFTASSFSFVVALFSLRCHFLNAYPYFSDNDWMLRRWGMCFQQELFALHSRCQHANLVDILHNSPRLSHP